MGSRDNRKRTKEDENAELFVFGYSCKLYPSDEKAKFISEEKHLQSWNGDGSLRIDRYDCRLLLTTIDDRIPERNDEEECPTEQMEEEMCEEERYKDMYLDIQAQAQREEEQRKKKNEINFNYRTEIKAETVSDESDSEDEPFVPPSGIKLPVGLATPENLKHSHIIERTAMFVVDKGPQMEIVIKAKQRNNTEQFGFLDFDNVLYPYYKYISKMIREKKYIPTFKSKEEREAAKKEPERKASNALTDLAAQHTNSEDDSDSDTELHPSLFAIQKREPSPDIIDRTKDAHGPRQKPEITLTHAKSDFNITQSNDMYASLFKSLTGYTEPKAEPKSVEPTRPASVPTPVKQEINDKDPEIDVEWQQWWMNFYGRPPPAKAPSQMIPPPPDMEPIVCRYAEFVARHGAQAEFGLVARPDLKLHFMDPNSPFFSYYQHKVRYAQWEMAQREPPPPPPNFDNERPESPSSHALLNRKQRRRLQDAQKVGPAPPPGVIDPFLLKASIQAEQEMHKTHSCPANLGTPENIIEKKLYVPTGAPVSFSLSKEETKFQSAIKQNLDESKTVDFPTSSISISEVSGKSPESPAQPLDRKEKARLFMEKLLVEKRNLKIKEADDAKIKELEKQKAEIEQKLAEEEMTTRPKERKPENSVKTLDMIDQLISSRIDNLLQASGMAPMEKKEEKKKNDDSPPRKRDRKREKKSKKHKKKRSRTRSRSRDRSWERRRNRRSRSRSREYRRNRY